MKEEQWTKQSQFLRKTNFKKSVWIREFKGNDLIDIRTWTMTQGTEDMVPTAKGVSINVQLLSELKKALEQVEKELKASGLSK